MMNPIIKSQKIENLQRLLNDWDNYDPRIIKVLSDFADKIEKSGKEILKLRKELKEKIVDVEVELEEED